LSETPKQFDPQTDPVYQSLLQTARANAVRDARTATNNALVSLGSRGIGNSSAAVDRANQIQQQAMANVLLNLEPQYLQQAYERYLQDRNYNLAQAQNLMNLAGMYGNLYQQELDNAYRNQLFDYQRQRDLVGDERWQQEFGYQQQRDQAADQRWQQQFEYQQQRDRVADEQWQQQFAYQQARDAIADQRYKQEFDEDVRRFGLQYALQKAQMEGQLDLQRQNLALDRQRLGLQQQQFDFQRQQASQPQRSNINLNTIVNQLNQLFGQTDPITGAFTVPEANRSQLRAAIISMNLPDDVTDQLLGMYGLPTN